MLPQSKQQLYKNRFFKVLKLVLPIGILIFLINYVKPAELLDRLKHANVHYLVIASLMVVPNLTLQYLKWALVCRNFLGIHDRKKILRSLFMGIGAGAFTPMKVGEYFARVISFKERKISETLLATAIDKLATMLVLTLLSSVAALIFVATRGYQAEIFSRQSYPILIVVGIGLGLVITYRRRLWRFAANRLKKVALFNIFFQSIARIRNLETRFFIALLLLTIFHYLNFTIQMTLLIGAFSDRLVFFLYFLIANLVVFAQVVLAPLGIGHIGVREAASVFFVELYGMAGAIGFNAGIFLFLINIVLPSMIGLGFFIKRENP